MKKWLPLMFFLVPLFLHQGCKTTLPQQTELMRKGESIDIPAYELRLRLNEFYYRFSMTVEEAADQIIAKADNPEVRQQALLWKMYAIPASQKAIFTSDPMAALVDVWALCRQMTDYWEEGQGSNSFGSQQVTAVVASKKLEQEVFDIVKHLSTTHAKLPQGADKVTQWAKEHPLESPLFTRRSTMELLASIIGSNETNLRTSFMNMAYEVEMMNTKVTMLSEFLPKQSRWQAEYLAYQFFPPENLQTGYDTYMELTDQINEFLTQRHEQILTDFRNAAFKELDRQRIAATEDLKTERKAVTDIFTNAITKEREAFVDALQKERVASFTDMEDISSKLLDKSEGEMHDLVDYIFKKALILIGVGGVIILLAIGLLKWRRTT